MRRAVCLPLFLFVALAGCGDTSTVPVKTEFDDVAVAPRCAETDTGANCLELKANAVRVDDEAKLKWTRADFDEATGVLQLELAAGSALPDAVKPGAVLFRGRKDRRPLLHRVDDVQQDGARVRLRLTRVTVKDAFERGRLRFRVPLGAKGPASSSQPLEGDFTRDGVAIARQPLDVSIGPSDCSGNVFDTAVVDARAQGQVRLDLTECRFVLTAWVDVVLRWDSAVNLDKLEVSVGGSVDAAMQAQLVASLNARFGANKRIWEGPEIPVTVGGVLFTLNPSVYAGYDLSARADLTVQQGFSYTGSITEGFGWSDKRKWYTIDERESAFTKYGPVVSFDGNVTATLWVKPRLDVKALGLVGGNIGLKAFAEGVITSTATSAAAPSRATCARTCPSA